MFIEIQRKDTPKILDNNFIYVERMGNEIKASEDPCVIQKKDNNFVSDFRHR